MAQRSIRKVSEIIVVALAISLNSIFAKPTDEQVWADLSRAYPIGERPSKDWPFSEIAAHVLKQALEGLITQGASDRADYVYDGEILPKEELDKLLAHAYIKSVTFDGEKFSVEMDYTIYLKVWKSSPRPKQDERARYEREQRANIIQQVDRVARKLFGASVKVRHKVTMIVNEVFEIAPGEEGKLQAAPAPSGEAIITARREFLGSFDDVWRAILDSLNELQLPVDAKSFIENPSAGTREFQTLPKITRKGGYDWQYFLKISLTKDLTVTVDLYRRFKSPSVKPWGPEEQLNDYESFDEAGGSTPSAKGNPLISLIAAKVDQILRNRADTPTK